MYFCIEKQFTDYNKLTVQFQSYIAESQLRFDLNPFEW